MIQEPDNTPWQECADCHRRDEESRMWTVEGRWLCDDCAADDLCEEAADG